ncbi:MAG: tetratricopeptide repeat protein [Thermoanaerobaculia bacterium]
MQRILIFPLAALLLVSAVGCGKVQARAELKKGNSYYQQEQYSKAMDRYQKGLELDPDATFAWRSLGLSALALYRPGDEDPKNKQYATTAIDAFEKYLAEYPDDEKIEDYLMATYVNAEKYQEALAFIDRRLQEKPEAAPKLQTSRINILTKADRLEEAFKMVSNLQGDEKAKALYSIGTMAWDKSYHDPGQLDYESKSQLIDMGLDAEKQALDVKPDYIEAMIYYSLLLREKAKVETDGTKRLEYEAEADTWRNKAMDLRKKKAAQPAPAPANT